MRRWATLLGAVATALLSGPAASASTWSDGLTAGSGPRPRRRPDTR